MVEKKHIAVVFGGKSSEHEVSRVSAQSILQNIDRNKYDVTMIGITREGRWLIYDGPVEKLPTGEWQAIAESQADSGNAPLPSSGYLGNPAGILEAAGAGQGKKKIDVVFPVLHGCNGEDGTIQGLLELAGIPYVGCGVLASALGMDKAYAKIIFEKEGIPQGKYLVFNRKQLNTNLESIIEQVENSLGYPCFVKPSNAGSSVGVSKAPNREKLVEALKLAARYDRRILVEEFIDGREVECAVLGNDEPVASTVGEIIAGSEFYDYQDKYVNDSSRTEIPANLPEETINQIRDYAVRAFKALDCAGLSRVDFFVHRKTGKIYINEINTLPGFTSISMYPKLWAKSGISYSELISRLIELALERFEDCKRDYSI
ncbi:MAG TPA: D-alanine--D-alanine ligase [Clostridiaceae bacterium]|nr:D-alanine--D-alanine ligase [Clostridiaceae bacterium]